MHPVKERPFWVSLTGWMALAFAAVNLTRVIQALRQWRILMLLTGVHPLYFVFSGLVWFVTGAALGLGILTGKHRAARAVPAVILLYSIWFWVERIFLAKSADRLQNWVFTAALNLTLAAGAAWALTRRRSKQYFEERYERESQDQPTA